MPFYTYPFSYKQKKWTVDPLKRPRGLSQYQSELFISPNLASSSLILFSALITISL